MSFPKKEVSEIDTRFIKRHYDLQNEILLVKRCMTFCVSQKGTQRFIKRGVFQKGGNIDTSWFPYVIRVYKNKFDEIGTPLEKNKTGDNQRTKISEYDNMLLLFP